MRKHPPVPQTHAETGTLRTALRSPLFYGWAIALLTIVTTETVLRTLIIIYTDAGYTALTALYFIGEFLSVVIPELCTVLLIALAVKVTPFILIPGYLIYCLIMLLCRTLTALFYTNYVFDTLWVDDVSMRYLLSLLRDDLFPFLLIVVLSLGFTCLSRWRIISLHPAILLTAFAFFLCAGITELVTDTLPYFRDVSAGYAVLRFTDAVYVVFKYFFYLLCAGLLCPLGFRFCRVAGRLTPAKNDRQN